MLEILNYLKARYMSEKAQGMVEYVVILALVVMIGIAVFGNGKSSGLGQIISDAFANVGKKVQSITGSN